MTEETAAEAAPGPAPVPPWPQFVGAWAAAHDGFDLRHAGPLAKHWFRTAYRVAVVALRQGVSQGTLVVTALLAVLLVPAFAGRGGRWPLVAALLVAIGLLADAVAAALGVLAARPGRLIGFYRTLVDRVGELCWLVAAWRLGGAPALVGACGGLTAVHEYVRLRATAAGMHPAGSATVGDRATRAGATLLILIVAAAVAGVNQDLAPGTTTLLLAGWALLAAFGLVQLLGAVRKSLR